jgi:hypothetical protein
MKYKELNLRADLPEQINTELLFEIASARAEGTELICINIFNEEKKYSFPQKQRSVLIKLIKNLKSEGRIQLFATSDSFRNQTTESYFLQNKYPEIFDSTSKRYLNENAVYIKL